MAEKPRTKIEKETAEATVPQQKAQQSQVSQAVPKKNGAALAAVPKRIETETVAAVAATTTTTATTSTTTTQLQASLATLGDSTATQFQVQQALLYIRNNLSLITDWNQAVNAILQNISAYGGPSALSGLDQASMQNLQLAMAVLGGVISASLAAQGTSGAAILAQSALDAAANAVAPFMNVTYASFASFWPAYTDLFAILNAEPAGQTPPAACSGAVPALCGIIQNATDQSQIAEALVYINGNLSPAAITDWNLVADALAQGIASYGSPSALSGLDQASMQNLEQETALLGTAISTNASLVAKGTSGVAILAQSALDAAANAVAPFMNGATYTSFTQMFQNSFGCFSNILNAEPAGQELSRAACSDALSTLIGLMGTAGIGQQVRQIMVSICKNRQGDVDGLVPAIQGYVQFFLQTPEGAVVEETVGGAGVGTGGYDDTAQFLQMLYFDPTALSTADCAAILEQWALNASTDLLTDNWRLLLANNPGVLGNNDFINGLKAQYDAQAPGNWQRGALGTCITICCFTNPALADMPAYKAMLGLDSATIAAMNAQSPSWATEPLSSATSCNLLTNLIGGYVPLWDFQKIYDISQAYPGEPVVKTLFNDNNITIFSNYPDDVIKHLYYDRDTTSEKPIVFMVFTKRPTSGPNSVNFGMIFNAFYYDNFDIRVIEPWTPQNMASLMESTSARLGEKKFSWLIVNGHGAPTQVDMKALANANVDPDIGLEPNDLNVNDGAILEQIKPLMVPGPYIVLNACSTAGGNGCYPDLAAVMAKDLQGICFGAEAPASGVQSIVYRENFSRFGGTDFGTEAYGITNVVFGGAETGVYDYRVPSIPGPASQTLISAPVVRHAGSTYTISAANGTECAVYDLRGRQIAKLAPNAAGEFTWNSSKAAAGTYVARISRVEEGKTIDAKSVSFSKTR
jgi:hypothetical protein